LEVVLVVEVVVLVVEVLLVVEMVVVVFAAGSGTAIMVSRRTCSEYCFEENLQLPLLDLHCTSAM
jgi:hypothetical protein